ncbi:MAG: hypothetical protein DHS20C11_33820 [Lysobacteraceae bacterium]|nr:MAG: hypothetical protein DHS20C11_33820 [Xanthomonadaceae bacterium]
MRFLLKGALLSLTLGLALSSNAHAQSVPELHSLGKTYFDAWVATQQPGATSDVLENYLALLDDNVGYEHKPHRLLGEVDGGKDRMREGMTYYLGKNVAFDVKLTGLVAAKGMVAIEYEGEHVFQRGGEGPVLTEQFRAVDVLEVADGKVAIIRQFRGEFTGQ